MNYLSVCSGVEAASVAWHSLGWNPLAFSEIEAFPSAVLAHHYPQVPNMGDMTNFNDWNLDGTVDLVVGGTPCQSFSVAGLRKGLEDPRGNLMLTYVGILNKFRPKWFIWENVPGVLSSNGGRDFGSLLGAVAELGYGFSYRVLDAQNFGVAQRRRRVFVVGHLGDWRPAAKVLFERESLSGNINKSGTERKTTPGYVESSFGQYREDSIGGTLKASGGVLSGGSETFITVYENHPADSRVTEMGKVCSTVTSRWGTGGGNVPFALAENTIGRQPMNGGNGNGFTEGGPMYTLNATGVHGVAIGFDAYNSTVTGNKTKTLDTGADYHHVPNVYSSSMAVRRLTPVECERLQGFPDNYTNIPWRKKDESPDGPRYKAMGNSMAVPVMRWIAQRIEGLK